MRTTFRGRAPLSLAVVSLFALAACGGGSGSAPPAQTGAGTSSSTTGAAAGSLPAVTSLEVSTESLQVDKVGPSDGMLKPDGSKDLAFTAQVTGPITAFFLVSSWPNGNPNGTFHANTLVANQQAPKEFGGELEQGKFTGGVGVAENGALLNNDDGSIKPLAAGPHTVTLYTANTGTLTPGTRVTLWAQAPDGTLVKSPVITLQ